MPIWKIGTPKPKLRHILSKATYNSEKMSSCALKDPTIAAYTVLGIIDYLDYHWSALTTELECP